MARAANKLAASGTARMVAAFAKARREQMGLTQEELGALIGYTASAISAMETCAQPASDKMLMELERVLGDGMNIFEMARKFVLLDKYPPQFQDFALMEAEAVTLSSYQTYVIDGLFQTPDYARSLIGGSFPKLPDEQVEQLVEARLARRALFDRSEPTAMIELILDESTLRRPFGSWETLRGQLRSLAEDSERDNVSVQVMPLDRGARAAHAGERGNMVLVETAEHHHVVYLEAHDESMLVSDPAKVARLAHRYAKIRTQALSPDDSASLIQKLAGEQHP
ncbi:Scr1 family TA system antitoxin-like transcriptional regulator [Streptomyces sp. SID1328]|uniref:helix-turn-helix domain-containing protein n=1 Tax=Streptomyces sp. SID1328 TaxID=2690250 RepID=UPI001F1BC7D9|nr:Scr1 family TA system antitoxin-like transcriptional regulator [Streptomyces sp. SID1328]